MSAKSSMPGRSGEVLTDVVVAIRDQNGWLSACVHEDVALTLFAMVSEDPSDWNELAGMWPRYRTPATPDQVSGVQMQRGERPSDETLRKASGWVCLDMVQCRVLTGGRFQKVERTAVYDMVTEGVPGPRGQEGWAAPVSLPPWWELIQHAKPSASNEARRKPVERCQANRRVLYGDALLSDFAARVIGVVRSDRWQQQPPSNMNDCYDWMVETHRDWLITPRADLNDATPREQLHGAIEWLEEVFEHQRIRIREWEVAVARPAVDLLDDMSAMGREEVCEYFSFCRELLRAGFQWAIERIPVPVAGATPDAALDVTTSDSTAAGQAASSPSVHSPGVAMDDDLSLIRDVKAAMAAHGEHWLDSIDEDGFTRRFAREAARRRMPLAMRVPVLGMDDLGAPSPPRDEMAALLPPGMMTGVSFILYDGFHLDYDREFAFSLYDDYEEWKWTVDLD